MNLEEFKATEDYPGYLVSEYGVVWDTRQGKELKWIKNNDFNCVNMYNTSGKKELVKIHQLVAKTFLIKPENATKIVVHKDLNRDNNHYTNLEWKIKGVSNKAFLRYSNYHGVKYHLTEIEEISEKSRLPIYTVRNRLEEGYTVEEIYQGYKNSDVYWVDGIKFIGELEVRRYHERKARELKQRLRKEKEDIIERLKLEEAERRRLLVEKRGTTDSAIVHRARSTWNGIMDRCYNPNRIPDNYARYGGSGVTVCEEWHDLDLFINWYVHNYIDGWDIEKDIIPLFEGREGKSYSPDNCCFAPRWLNQWLAKTRIPVIQRLQCGEMLMQLNVHTRFNNRQKIVLRAFTEEYLLEQYFLTKDLHFEKRVWESIQYHKKLCEEYPNSPQISPKLLSIISKFSTEKYLSLSGK